MSHCRVCRQELEEGFDHCHYCGAPRSGGGIDEEDETPGSGLVALVDGLKNLAGRSSAMANDLTRGANDFLGSPVSAQRQVVYALLTAFVLSAGAWARGPLTWLQVWLLCSLVLLLPIQYWITGIMPLSGFVNLVLGGEYSLRRRVTFSLLAGVALPLFSLWFVGEGPEWVSPRNSPPPPQAALWAELARGIGAGWRLALFLATSFLSAFYWFGFVQTWRPAPGWDTWITLRTMGDRADAIAEHVHEAVTALKIPSLEVTRLGMKKLRRFSSGISDATRGEQICFFRGRARTVLLVQNLGDAVHVRWFASFDVSGRRIWLLYGMLIEAIDRLFARWFDSSLLDAAWRIRDIIRPSSRHHQLLLSTKGGIISRALRLSKGIPEYTWSEVFGLFGAVGESAMTVLAAQAEDHEQAEAIRAQIGRLQTHEKEAAESRNAFGEHGRIGSGK